MLRKKKKEIKRLDYLSWNDFFMGVAKLAAQRSKDPSTQVGACIVKDKKIIGVGYNGMPNGCSDDLFPWGKDEDPGKSKYSFVVHAEENCILNCSTLQELKGATLFCTLFPCNECAKTIVQVGIKKIYYLDDKHSGSDYNIIAKKIFDFAGVSFEQYVSVKKEINLVF
jgi:dCMP deaminase